MKSLELPGVTSIAPGQDIQTNKQSTLAFRPTDRQSELPVCLTCMSLDCVGKPEKPLTENTVIMQTFTMNDNIMKKI